jgi:hypothetical protein
LAIYTNYATHDDVAEYLGKTVEELPSDIIRLISRASELIHQLIKYNYISTNEDHQEAAKLATCAQVEYMQSVSEDALINPNVQSFSIGSVSMQLGQAGSRAQLSLRSKSYLNEQGLLYKGRLVDGGMRSDET